MPEKPPEKDFVAQKLGMTHLFLLLNIYQMKNIDIWARATSYRGKPKHLNDFSWFGPFSILNYDLEAFMNSKKKKDMKVGVYTPKLSTSSSSPTIPQWDEQSPVCALGVKNLHLTEEVPHRNWVLTQALLSWAATGPEENNLGLCWERSHQERQGTTVFERSAFQVILFNTFY